MSRSPHPFVPIAAPSRLPGWRRVLPLVREPSDEQNTLRILWHEVFIFFVALLCGGYLALLGGVWAFLRYERGIDSIRFTDLLLPSRWENQRLLIGDHYVSQGRKQLEAGEFYEALLSLRRGVAKAPANLSGRALLARLYLAARRSDYAEGTLLGGLPFASKDPDYLRTLFSFLLDQQRDDVVRQRARELLGTRQLSPECTSLVALAAASASYFRGNYDEADTLLQTHHLGTSHDGRLLSAQIEWERGYRDLAVLQLRNLTEEFPANDQARSQLATWFRELGQLDDFRRITLLRQIASPQNSAPRIELLRTLRTDEPAKVRDELETLLHDAANDERLLLALADFAVETGDPVLARRIYDRCRQLNRGWEAAAFLHVEALVVARDYRGALERTRQLLEANRDWAKRYYALFNSLQSISYYGLGDSASAQLYLANFLGQADLRADNLLAVAQRFVDVGARAEARQTLAQAVAADPLNQAALTRLIQLDLELNRIDVLPPNLRRLLAMRRPSPSLLRLASAKLGSDLFLFSRERNATLTALQRALASNP